MDFITSIADWISQNWQVIILVVAGLHELLTLIDKLLPESIKVDNHLADYIAKILKSIAPEKKTG